MDASGQELCGAWEAHTDSMWFDVQLQVDPAVDSLKCADCHAAEGRLDLASLGYSEEQTGSLIMLGAGLAEEPAAPAAEAPAAIPEAGSALAMPSWVATALAGVVAAAAGLALRKSRK